MLLKLNALHYFFIFEAIAVLFSKIIQALKSG